MTPRVGMIGNATCWRYSNYITMQLYRSQLLYFQYFQVKGLTWLKIHPQVDLALWMPIFHLLKKGFLLQVIDILNQSILIVIEATPSNTQHPTPPSPPLGSPLLLIKRTTCYIYNKIICFMMFLKPCIIKTQKYNLLTNPILLASAAPVF